MEGRKIALIYIDAGGGHRAAATALCEVIREQRRPWQVEMFSIQDLLNSIDFVRKCTGIPFEDVYNIMLRRGWTLGTAQTIPLMHLLIRLSHGSQVRVLERHWAQYRPDLVVSLLPHYNRALKTALDRAWPRSPFVTVLTDIADYPLVRVRWEGEFATGHRALISAEKADNISISGSGSILGINRTARHRSAGRRRGGTK